MQMSALKVYSIGIVAANKKILDRIIEVTPIEDAPMMDGELNSQAHLYKTSGTDRQGGAYDVEVNSAKSIKAEWLPLGSSNRLSAPDVRRGAEVVIYRIADTDKYYWTTFKDDMNLRKLETAIYAWSGTMDEDAKTDGSNSYFLEISTHKKHVHFHTSKANGEPFAYDISINTDYGCITITDDQGNFFSLDSKERRLEMVNVDGSSIDLNKKTLTITTPDAIVMKTKSFSLTADSALIKATTTNDGSLTIKGKTTMQSGMTVSGGSGGSTASITGDLQLNGNGVGTGSLTVNQLISTQSVIAPNV